MISNKKNTKDIVTKIGLALLAISIILLLAKNIIHTVNTEHMYSWVNTIGIIVSGILILIAGIKKQTKHNIIIKISLTILICQYVFFLIVIAMDGISYNLREFVQCVVFVVGYTIALATEFNKIKKVTLSRVLLTIMLVISSVESLQLVFDMLNRYFNTGDFLYYYFVSAFGYMFFDIAIAMIIPNVINRQYQENTDNFDKVSYLLLRLKMEYEKGNISKEQYDNDRAELLKQI